jgi:hypothetical protein
MKLVQFDCHWNFHTLRNDCTLDVPKMFLIDLFFIVGNINHDFPILKFNESTTTMQIDLAIHEYILQFGYNKRIAETNMGKTPQKFHIE